MIRKLLFLLLLYSSQNFAQDTPNNVRSFKLYSNILKEDRFFDVYIPTSSKTKFDVIYVLDGQAQFGNVINALKQLDQNQKIVVGIGNIWTRDRDYTPTPVKASAFLDSITAAISGGGKKFIAHLEKELIPYINSHYPADTSKILIGHSLGGLLAMDIMLNNANLFSKFIIIDPSMWWDDAKLVHQSKDLLKIKSQSTHLFLAIANTRNKDMESTEAIRNDTTLNTAQIRPGLILIDYLRNSSKRSIKMDWKFYKNEDHMSVFQPAVNEGLTKLLNVEQ